MDTPGDLSSTTLYAAQLDQKSDVDGGQFGVSWVELGSNTQDALETAINGGVVFSDLFTSADVLESGECPDGFKSINQGGDGQECVSLVEGQENLAAYLEPRRTAAYLGATTEGSKWEGFVYDPYTKKAYTSISDVRYGMEDSKKKGEDEPKYDAGGAGHISLPYNKCGCVYALEFDSDFVATSFNAALCGSPMPEDEFGQVCDVNSVSNPDNLARVGKTILIGEDTVRVTLSDACLFFDVFYRQISAREHRRTTIRMTSSGRGIRRLVRVTTPSPTAHLVSPVSLIQRFD